MDLGGTKIEIAALSAAGETLLRRRVPSPSGDYDAIVATIATLVAAAERELGTRATVGIGTPGSASPQTGRFRNANSTVLNGRSFERDMAAALGRGVRVANDANCFALSEAVDGAGAGARCVFGAILGTGVGGAVVADRSVRVGRNAIAGEWGHNPLPWPAPDEVPGPPCYCGKAGCVETFLSGPGLARAARAAGATVRDAAELGARAAAGDALAATVVARYVDRLARALATVVNLLDPDVVVLGGGVSNLDAIYPALPEALRRYVFSDAVGTPVLRAAHGDSSGVRGAAWLWDAPAGATWAGEAGSSP